jgi:hypothetical protein
MQTPHTKPILRKRAAPEGIATQSRTKVQKLAQPTVGAECLFLNKLAQELRDHIYDYVAMTETKIGLYVNFMEDTNFNSHAYSYKGLGDTCRQIRQQYSLRLEHRIKQLVIGFRNTEESTPTPRMYCGGDGILMRID